LLDNIALSNTDLGDIFAGYGISAMLCYLPGGLLADHYSARRLLTTSLAATAAGGLYYAQQSDLLGLSLLYAYWGITTILLFWAGLI